MLLIVHLAGRIKSVHQVCLNILMVEFILAMEMKKYFDILGELYVGPQIIFLCLLRELVST